MSTKESLAYASPYQGASNVVEACRQIDGILVLQQTSFLHEGFVLVLAWASVSLRRRAVEHVIHEVIL